MQDKKTGIPAEKVKPGKTGKRPVRPAAASVKRAAAVRTRTVGRTKTDNLRPGVFVQFQGGEISIEALLDAAEEDFRQIKQRAPITDLKLYVKPEEYTAYYVINKGHEGKVTF